MAANETIGSVPCAFCGCKSPVRKNAKQKLYYVCPGDGDRACGIVQPNMPGFQEWILEKATITGAAAPAVDALTAAERADIKPDVVVVVHAEPDAPPAQQNPLVHEKLKKRGFGVIKF